MPQYYGLWRLFLDVVLGVRDFVVKLDVNYWPMGRYCDGW
jgi:hypothetical protein